MPATWTPSARRKCVPHHSAALEHRLGSTDTLTAPDARRIGLPAAERTSNAADCFFIVCAECIDGRRAPRAIAFQEQTQYCGRFHGDSLSAVGAFASNPHHAIAAALELIRHGLNRDVAACALDRCRHCTDVR